MLLELLPLVCGGVFGAVTKLFSMGMQNRRDERLGVIEALKAQAGANQAANDMALKSNGFAITRRIIALSITGLVVILSLNLTGEGIFVMEEIKTGGSYLFGIIDTTNIKQVWTKLEGAVALPVVLGSFQAIVGCYFGASIAGSK